jgi:outer membrane protein assembly factor BamB
MPHLRNSPPFVLVIAVVILCTACVNAGSWSRFRGPNGTGVSTDKEIPVQWNEKEEVLWKTSLPGLGHSSPVVWENNVFLQCASEDGKERRLVCLSAVDGKVRWSTAVPGAVAKTHRKNSLASSTPATDGERVYALFWDGEELSLSAFDFQGNAVWRRGLGVYISQHGPGHSPMVYNGKVYLANDQDGTATVLALDAKTGKPVWQAGRKPFRACYSTPILLERPGAAPELLVLSTAGISGYDPATGNENWSYNWTFSGMALRTIALPIYSGGLLFCNSGDGGGARATIAVKPGGQGDVTKTNLVWEKTKTFPYVPTMLASGEHLYFINDHGFAGCAVAKTGEIIWLERLCKEVFASPILVDGKVYAISEEGTVYVYPAAASFHLLAKNSMGERVLATPAVADGRLYIRGEKHLFCIGKPSDRRAAR